MPLQTKMLACTSCGASLEIKNALKAKVLVCQHCGAQLDLTDPQYAVIGRALKDAAPPRSWLRLGMEGTLQGEKYQIIGRVRYREDPWFWDEWLLMTEEGRYKWLTEGEEEITLWESFTPTEPTDPRGLEEGDTIRPEGRKAQVKEVGRARIDYVEGELTWKARLGETISYLDARENGGKYSIEWSEKEIEFYKGRQLSSGEVMEAFGQAEAAAVAPPPSRGRKGRPLSCASIIVIIVILLVIVFLCVACSIISPSVGTGPSTGGYQRGPSVRIGSPAGRTSTGGGFTGGK
ncbi:MAG: DUF4178 domain-containing protein [Chloroflexota bacterium]